MTNNKYLRRQGNVWYVELVVPRDVSGRIVHNDRSLPSKYGKPLKKFSKSLRTSNLKEAKERSHSHLAKWYTQIAHARNSVQDICDIQQNEIQFDHFLENWLAHHKYSLACELVARKLISDEIKQWFPTFSMLNERKFKLWVKELENGNSPSGRKLLKQSISRRISTIRAYVEYCIDHDLVDCSYVPTTKLLTKSSRTKANRRNGVAASYHPFTKDEVRNILKIASKKRDRRLYYVTAIGLFTGCRISEICALKTNSVSSDKIIIYDSKTYSGVRKIPIHPEVWQLTQFLKTISTDGFLISGLSSNNRQINRAKGMINKFSRLKNELGFGSQHGFHSFRSTLAHQKTLERKRFMQLVF